MAGKFWQGIKFGGLAVYLSNRQFFLLTYNIRMAIPYLTAKFKSTYTFGMVIWDPTAKLNSRQYFYASYVPCLFTDRQYKCYAQI